MASRKREVNGRKKEVKVRIPSNAWLARFLLSKTGRVLAILCAVCVVGTLGVFTYFYSSYARLIDKKLTAGPFANTSKLYAMPETVAVGDLSTPDQIAFELRRSGYSESRSNPMGWFRLGPAEIEIFPGPESYFDQEAGVIRFSGKKISQIVSLQDNTVRGQFQLEPQLITNLFDRNREKRRLVKFADIPPVLINAVTSAEDKRFFQHRGFDPLGIVRAVYVDVKEGRKDQGASTLTQQLARALWLNPSKSFRRKLAESLITLQLEQKLSKEQIFEDYSNQMYLGRRGSFSIQGFGEAAWAYFRKDIRQLNLPEAATLAAMLQNANIYNPYRFPDRVRERRNWVLGQMRQNGHITDREYAEAEASPLNVSKGASQSVDAPYFVDMLNDALQTKFQDYDFQNNSFRVYTGLDMNLQRAAVEAIRIGMQNVDDQIRRQRRFRGQTPPEAQCALIALDPHTAEIRALAGGRNYGMSQLNHVLAKRQPGSIFKPFVYAAAMDTAIEGGPRILTASTTVDDQPTTFWFDNKPYEPSNFEHKFYGNVTLRQALAHSLNVATVKVGEMVGFDRVVELSKKAGLNYDIHPTPAVALGAYDVTPMEMAGAYTIFANQGVYVRPNFIGMVRTQEGKIIYTHKAEKRTVLDPRVAYLMTNLMEEVMRTGTAAGVRARGFVSPAAGKTGTSHDGWFAGYTSELLCIVWVGFDDNRELDLEGARSALPIWTEFMKRALDSHEYRSARPFAAPDGIVSVLIDPLSGMPATPMCPSPKTEVYIAGTQPMGICPLHGSAQPGMTNVAGWDVTPKFPALTAAPAANPANPPTAVTARRPSADLPAPTLPVPDQTAQQSEKTKEKKGIFHRLWGVFK